MNVLKACRQCMYLDEVDTCPVCGHEEMSKEWQGYVIIVDYTKSEIAKKMGITHNGKYALKVR